MKDMKKFKSDLKKLRGICDCLHNGTDDANSLSSLMSVLDGMKKNANGGKRKIPVSPVMKAVKAKSNPLKRLGEALICGEVEQEVRNWKNELNKMDVIEERDASSYESVIDCSNVLFEQGYNWRYVLANKNDRDFTGMFEMDSIKCRFSRFVEEGTIYLVSPKWNDGMHAVKVRIK